jgi:hypothetical protein
MEREAGVELECRQLGVSFVPPLLKRETTPGSYCSGKEMGN